MAVAVAVPEAGRGHDVCDRGGEGAGVRNCLNTLIAGYTINKSTAQSAPLIIIKDHSKIRSHGSNIHFTGDDGAVAWRSIEYS